MGRTKVGWFGWDGERTRGFAAARGFEPKSVAVCRRQHVRELEPGLADRLYAEALPHAGEYELLRIAGRMPDELLDAFLAGHGRDQRRAARRPGVSRTRCSPPTANRAFEDAQLGQRLPHLPDPRPAPRDRRDRRR